MAGELRDNVVWLSANDDGTYRISSAADALRAQVTSGLATYGETSTLAVMTCTLPGKKAGTSLVYHPGGDSDGAKLTAGVSGLGVLGGLMKSSEARKGNYYYVHSRVVDHRQPGKGYGGLVQAGAAAISLGVSLHKLWKAHKFKDEGYYTDEKKPSLVIRGRVSLTDLRPYHDIY
ncbi:hypothetical protein ACFPM7_14135 [Actinokineospora guangxiensis]|uniref:Uncharacterized protein n=1 Tax=Actinokineospora guangxiensis TaxID=1490288 RepID=A0ABW0EQ85_9PSEU